MKIFALIGVLIIASCATVPVQNPVCPQEDSWICEKSAELGVQPETVYSWIYSAAAVGAVSDVFEIQEVCDFEHKIANWYEGHYPISYDTLIAEVLRLANVRNPEKALLLKNIINTNLTMYSNISLISAADDIILRKGHVAFRRDMLCYERY